MSSKTRTILIVDDDNDFLASLCEIIGSEYSVIWATNGEDAVESANSKLPDLILLDVMMPGGMDGFATFAELRRSPKTREIPAIMLTDVNRMTGLTFGEKDMVQYLGKSPSAFLDKSVKSERLLAEIRKALGSD